MRTWDFPAENCEYPYYQEHGCLIVAEIIVLLRAVKGDSEEHGADAFKQEFIHAVAYDLAARHVAEMIVLGSLHIDLIIKL